MIYRVTMGALEPEIVRPGELRRLTLAPDDAAGRAALAACVRGELGAFTPADCEERILASMVGGRFCDGEARTSSAPMDPPIACVPRDVRRADGTVSRMFNCCVPRAMVERKRAAIEASPLPVKPQRSAGVPTWALVAGGLGVGGLLLVALTR